MAVVVRTKGRPLLLQRALRSIAAQTYADWQAVVVSSPDEADDVAAALESAGLADDARVHRVSDPGEGRAAAANAGLAAVEGDLVVLHDDDDSWAPGFLAATVAHLEAHPELVGVATRAEVVTETIGDRGVRETGRELLAPDVEGVSLLSVARRHHVPAISLVVRRDAQREVGELDTSLPVLEDWDFLLRLLARGPVGFLDEPLAHWHQRPGPEGSAANSVVALAGRYPEVEERIRDRFLRAAVTTQDGSEAGLGLPVAVAGQLDDQHSRLQTVLAAHAAAAASRGEHHREHIDLVANAQTEHFTLVTTELRLEVGRLRGEVMVLRELVKELTDELEETREDNEDLLERTTDTLEAALDALRDLAAEPGRPGRDVVDGITGRVAAAWRRSRATRRPQAE